MGVEIERKFLVSGAGWRLGVPTRMRQGYLSRDKHRTVRVRVAGELAFLTVKGISTGALRSEFEYPIPVQDAHEMLALCEGPLIEKTRFVIAYNGTTWEVDAFAGENAGLVVAEVELTHEDQAFDKPDWVGDEVTHDPRYFNANLAALPYCRWPPEPPADAKSA